MGPFLVVQGESEQAGRQFLQGISLFEKLLGLRPVGQTQCASTRVAAFPTLRGEGQLFVTEGGQWMCQSGLAFYQNRPVAPQSLIEPGLRDPLSVSRELDGVFALVFGDQSGRVYLATDRLGSLHVYLAEIPGGHILCTSSMVLSALLRPAWSAESLREFFSYGNVFEHRTLFEGLDKLEPATLFEFCSGRPTDRRRYWNSAEYAWDQAAENGTAGELAHVLTEAADAIFRPFPEAVCDLTGGFDSRAVIGAALRAGHKPCVTVTGTSGDRDVAVAGEIAAKYGLALHCYETGWSSGEEWWQWIKKALPLTDGEHDVLEYARIYRLHHELSSRFSTSVNGSNGEICKGYWWELLHPHLGSHSHFDSLKIARGRFAFNQSAVQLLRHAYPDALDQHYAGVIDRASRGWEHLPNTARLDNIYLSLRMQRWQGRMASSTCRIWPSLSPFLFHKPMQTALAVPPPQKIRHRLSRALIEALDPSLAAMPLAQGYPASPLKLSNLHRFWPLAAELGGKVGKKLRQRLPPAGQSVPVNPLTPLWGIPEFRDLAKIDEMRTAQLYHADRLRAFIHSAQQPAFAGQTTFARILTLEMLGRALESGSIQSAG